MQDSQVFSASPQVPTSSPLPSAGGAPLVPAFPLPELLSPLELPHAASDRSIIRERTAARNLFIPISS